MGKMKLGTGEIGKIYLGSTEILGGISLERLRSLLNIVESDFDAPSGGLNNKIVVFNLSSESFAVRLGSSTQPGVNKLLEYPSGNCVWNSISTNNYYWITDTTGNQDLFILEVLKNGTVYSNIKHLEKETFLGYTGSNFANWICIVLNTK